MSRRLLVVALVAVGACTTRDTGTSGRGDVRQPDALPATFGAGRAATPEEVAAWDLDVNPKGIGLPAGQGTAAEGAVVYAAKCASCHGPTGRDPIAPNPKLVGRELPDFSFATSTTPVAKTIGNYWPYATTLYDYIRRAMPQTAPGTLTANETYAVIAWLLAENEVIPRDQAMDATSLPAVVMPSRDKFVRDDRTGGAGFR